MISISPYYRGSGALSSLRLLAARDRFIDPRHQLLRQWAGINGRYALSELRTVLYTEHKCIDIERQRVAMRESGGSEANLLGQSPEAGRPSKIAHLSVVGGQESIDCTSQRSRLHRAN